MNSPCCVNFEERVGDILAWPSLFISGDRSQFVHVKLSSGDNAQDNAQGRDDWSEFV
jgi:hypothetical protein